MLITQRYVSPVFLFMDPRFQKFIELFNEEKFFEAHEVLELLWREIEGPEKKFYQGLIQIAAVFVHLQKDNREGAKQLYQKAFQNLFPYGAAHAGLPLAELLAKTAQAIEFKTAPPRIKFE